MKRWHLINAALAAVAMLLAAATAEILTPRKLLADDRGNFSIKAIVPERFSDWRVDGNGSIGLINPVQSETLGLIYSQILERTYINTHGQRVMLSVTYGRDQRADKAVHYPEVCYPAQGFEVKSNRVASMQVVNRQLPVRRLETSLHGRRIEPVTYWTTIGEFNSMGRFSKRVVELRYGLNGVIPDGILFRVSTIGEDSVREFSLQEEFIQSLLLATDPGQREALTGRQVP